MRQLPSYSSSTRVSSNASSLELDMLVSRVEQRKLVRHSSTQLSIIKYLNSTFFYLIVAFNDTNYSKSSRSKLNSINARLNQNSTPANSTQLKLDSKFTSRVESVELKLKLNSHHCHPQVLTNELRNLKCYFFNIKLLTTRDISRT